jgi:diguanylate cyclase
MNYWIWYEYASGKNKDLNETIDKLLKDMGSFSVELTPKIYRKFIADRKDVLNELVRDEIKKIFGQIISSIKSTNQQYNESDTHLEAINDSLDSRMPESDMMLIVSQIRNEINSLESTNAHFKDQLKKATSEIDQLKNKLDHYRKEALIDPLTQIINRRGFDNKLKDAIDKANNNETSLCLIMADIDHFKKINDTHGHLAGDSVLRMVAAVIKDSIKGRDQVARIGGEEFAVILPDTPFEGAMKLAENMRIAFEQRDLKKKNSKESLGKVTLSFGVTMHKKSEPADVFVDRADKALYKAKKNGRNRVTGI